MNKKIKIKDYIKIDFPSKNHFAESLIIKEEIIYFPLNYGDKLNCPGLYSYNLILNKFNLIFKFPNNDIVFGCRISNNKFIGAVTSSNSIIIYDMINKNYKYIPLLLGCPNDLCIDTDNKDIIYVGINTNNLSYNGIILRINIETEKIEILIGDHLNAYLRKNLYSICGINIIKNIIYVSGLIEVYSFDKNNLENFNIIIKNNKNNLFYDNISIYKDDLNIAIFDYNQTFMNIILKNKYLLSLSEFLFYLIFQDLGYLNKTNNDRKMYNSKIKFINLKKNKYKLCYFDKIIDNFDKVSTQINKISKNKYIVLNYKANVFIIINT